VSAPCNHPLLNADRNDEIKVIAKLASAPVKTVDGLEPSSVTLKLCFSKPSTKDRPWRKPADVIDVSAPGGGGACALCRAPWARRAASRRAPSRRPATSRPLTPPRPLTRLRLPPPPLRPPQKDKACPYTVAKLPLSDKLTTYEATFVIPKVMPKATLYAQAMVTCNNGTEGPVFCQYDNTVGKAYVGTDIIDSTPGAMKVAVGICSAIAPAFLAAFFYKENYMKKRA
jgi:hypothetical protein